MNIENLNKAFENKVRLGIMSILAVEHETNFNSLKESLQVSDGNLASHLKGLEEVNYISVQKGFIGRKTNTVYTMTSLGEKAFRDHLNELEKFIKNLK